MKEKAGDGKWNESYQSKRSQPSQIDSHRQRTQAMQDRRQRAQSAMKAGKGEQSESGASKGVRSKLDGDAPRQANVRSANTRRG